MSDRRFRIWCAVVLSLFAGLGTCEECPSLDNESSLQKDRVYTYRYRSEALSQAVGTTEEHGRIALECDVRIEHERACVHYLRLEECTVTAAGGETAWMERRPLPDLSKYPVAFSLVSGEVREVRKHEEDPLHYVNIKRGVLSAFVFKLSQAEREVHESHTDVHGTCPMTSLPEEELSVVKTSKDMLRCHFPSRPDWQFSPWSLFWNMSFIQHVINSTTNCIYSVDSEERRIEDVSCDERHAIMLESTQRTAAAVQTNVRYRLHYVRSQVQASKPTFPVLSRQTGIQYEYEETPAPRSSPPDFLSVAEKRLADLVLDSVDEVRLSTISQFADLVAWLRSAHDVTPLVDTVASCQFLPKSVHCNQKMKELARCYVSDALLQCNSLPCAEALTHMAARGELSPAYLRLVHHSWSYMHYSKPGFVANFVNICRLANSNQCWMSLGSFVRRIYSRYVNLDEKVHQEVNEMANYVFSRIGEECEETKTQFTDCLIFMKAASDMGPLYATLVPEGVNQLLQVATDERSPTVARTSALEALKEVSDPESRDERLKIYDQLLPLFNNQTLPPTVRVLSYDLLIVSSEDIYFGEHLLRELKEGRNAEVKYYVADTLNTLMSDAEFRSRRKKFLNFLNVLLRENDLSLEWILYETKGKSKSSSRDIFLNLPFMPDSVRRFGMKLKDSFIYDSPIYPAIFNQEAIFQLFGTFLPASKLGSYFEGFEELIGAYQKSVAEMDAGPVPLSRVYEAVAGSLGGLGGGSLLNFDETVLSNVERLHRMYWEHHKKLEPYAKVYLKLFGSTLNYLVHDHLRPGKDGLGNLVHALGQRLADGVSFNTTRVVRVIEAYHQVPTMMGLPLNWTTNATLAFSLRAGLQYKMDREDGHTHAKGVFQPSAALTFLNRMVLDFPTLTQIGVQANSSAYTSTDLRAQYNSARGKQALRFDGPSGTQKVLQLFRTNQLIQHNTFVNIPDWDIERTSSSWCESAGGLKICLSKSYPNVTHRLKPWALMAGWCKWEFLVHPSGEHAVHYDFELHQAAKQKLKEYTAKFAVTEKERERAARFKAVVDESGKDLKVEVKTALMPDFGVSLSRSEMASGQKIEANVRLSKDAKYELELTTERKASTKDDKVSEERLTLGTPCGAYRWNRTVLSMGENVKAEANLSYENLGAKSEWLRTLLPPSFWESERKASLQIQLHWKKPIHHPQGVVSRQTVFRLRLPRYLMEMSAGALESRPKHQTYVRFARTDRKRGELDAFLNFTSDWWSNEDKAIGVVNITIPRRSWSASYQSVREGGKFHHEVALKRALMKPREGEQQSDYVGWWSREVSDRFNVEEQEIQLVAVNEWLSPGTEEITSRFPTVTSEDLEGLRSAVVVSEIVLRYPFNGSTESLVYDGYLVLSSGPTAFRFQKNFDLTSSYHNQLRLTSHSVYRSGAEGTRLDHSSHAGKAHNTIRFTSEASGRCRHLTFKHDIRSHAFDLSTDAVYGCEADGQDLHTLRLTLNTNSSKWNMLDIKLDQIVEDVSEDYSREVMTTSHPAGTIRVDADWNKNPYHHQKKVVLCIKDDHCPSAELFLEFQHDGSRIVRLLLPNRNDTQVLYERKMSSDFKHLDIKIGFANREDGMSDLLDLSGQLISRHFHVWKGTFNSSTYEQAKGLFVSGYEAFSAAFARMAGDEGHPLNEMLRPAIKVTLLEYWRGIKAQASHFLSTSWEEVSEVVRTFGAFAEPAYAVLLNVITSANEICRAAYDSLKETSVAVWAIDYFHLPHYVQQGFAYFPQAMNQLLKQLALGEEDVAHFKFTTGKIVALTSFREWPSIEFSLSHLQNLISRETEGSADFNNWGRGQKLAMLFGPLHVYTFDGHLYDAPQYPHEDCLFLLAHDVHKSLFTVMSSRSGIHVLFPEMSVTVDEHNQVFINGSRQPSSLPVQAGNGKVTVKRSEVVEIWSPSLSLVCRSRDFLCLLKLGDHHAGGVIGLLGNADGDSSNDLVLPTGNTSSTLVDFIRAYEVSGQSECHNLVIRVLPGPSEDETQACLDKLKDVCPAHSQMRDRFLEACISDVRESEGACYAASGLSALCHLRYEPSHTDCSAKKQEKESIGRRLEVVLVVHENKYLSSPDKSSSPIKGIESLVKALDEKFKGSGYASVLYSLVGFGGSGVHYSPTVHSSQKTIWLPADGVIDEVLKTLEFKSREEADGVKALRYALEELGHDTFDSKIFIVIVAKDKQVAEKPVMDWIQQQLERNGITLYTFSSYPSIEKGKKVFGVRADGLIFPAQSKDGDGYLDYPRGNLAKLSSSTRGSVFLSKFLREGKPQAFFAEFAQEVWAKVNKEVQKCRSCRHVPGGWWWYRNECSIVHC